VAPGSGVDANPLLHPRHGLTVGRGDARMLFITGSARKVHPFSGSYRGVVVRMLEGFVSMVNRRSGQEVVPARPAGSSLSRSLFPVLLALISTSVYLGCRTEARLQEEHAEDLDSAAEEPLRVIDYLPPYDVPGVPSNMQPYFFFNREIGSPEELRLVVANNAGLSIPYTFELDFDSAGITFIPDGMLYGYGNDADFSLTLEDGTAASATPLVDHSPFSILFPPGAIFNMSTDLACTVFGGSKTSAKLVNEFFEPGVYPLWLMVVEDVDASTLFPTSTRLLIGPAYIRPNGNYRIYRHVGFATVFRDVAIDPIGRFEAHADGAFLPLDTPDKVVLTYLVDISVRGTFDFTRSPARIRDFVLTGVFPARSLLLLSDQSDSYATAIKALSLDVDLNGNGENDACNFEARSQPEEIPFSQVDP